LACVVTFVPTLLVIGILLGPLLFVIIILALIAEIVTCVSASRGGCSRYSEHIRYGS
jgi:hypothetical protein